MSVFIIDTLFIYTEHSKNQKGRYEAGWIYIILSLGCFTVNLADFSINSVIRIIIEDARRTCARKRYFKFLRLGKEIQLETPLAPEEQKSEAQASNNENILFESIESQPSLL